MRAGLGQIPRARRYRMKPSDLGVRPGVDLTKPLSLAGELADAEIVRKLDQGHGAALASFDGDLHRFGGLKLEYLR
jgi:hypothetical protein